MNGRPNIVIGITAIASNLGSSWEVVFYFPADVHAGKNV